MVEEADFAVKSQNILNIPKKYDFIVIGGGSAGLTAVDFASKIGASVLLVEADETGGDCTWFGCIPSKSLIHCANLIQNAREGINNNFFENSLKVNFPEIKKYVRNVIEKIASTESPEVLRKSGIDVVLGEASFLSSNLLNVGEEIFTSKNFLICTGAKPIIPYIEGLDKVPYLTYETILDLNDLPHHLIIIGGGPIGSEMGQAFRRFGSEVTIIEGLSHLLPKDNIDACKVIEEQFQFEGIEVVHGEFANRIEYNDETAEITVFTSHFTEIRGSHVLIATGRKPNINKLNLEAINVELRDNDAIKVDKFLRTSQKHIFAAGDCIGGLQFTHLAGYQGFVATRNALLPGKMSGKPINIPWTTFTQPEVAHIGLKNSNEYKNPSEVLTCYWPLNKVDRAITNSKTRGFIKIFHKENGKILGATVVAPRGGEIISEFSIALEKKVNLDEISAAIHVYPSYSIGVMQAAAGYRINQFLRGFSDKMILKMSRFFR
ncbi:MAG: dihydrolipoyl dehydrogenase family protein [Candidatus Hodarchaeales archaeon]|jgi:pyruvate/2-oxoglutarate dehydrogenase complex dihydrolipoamide dehydrogenase (E3) component